MPAKVVAEDVFPAVDVLKIQNVALVSNDSALNVTPMLACSLMSRALGADSTSETIAFKCGDGSMITVSGADKIQPRATGVCSQKLDFSRAASPMTRERYSRRGSALLSVDSSASKISWML
jgi:dihydroxyacid dehydratase/phosphogluconate dehydratase